MDLTQQQHDEILKRVQNRINEFLGSDVEKLSKLSELHDEWDAKRKEIEQSLSLTGDEVPSKVGKIVKEIDTTCGELSANCQQVSLTLAEISKATCSTDDVYLLLEGNFDKIGRLTHAHAYLSILDYIEQLSNRMEGYVAGRDVYTARAIDEYRKLCELCVKVNKTSCAHLRTYLVDTLKYWHSILKKDIVEDFVTCMKNVQWPVVSSNNLLSSPSADSLSKFQHGLSRLLQIVIPCGNMRDRYGALSFSVNDWKEFLVQSKQSFKKRYYAKSPSDVSRDDFDILRTLGSGSFGRVLLARRKSDNHYFAIKVLDKAKVVKTKQVEHTLNEKQILQAVRCPFTVHLEQFFQDNLYLFFVLPLVVGGEMFTHLRKLGKFHESVTRFYAAQVILGLEYLHFLDLIYRDLKPENLLIDHIGYLKITDFGFCKILKKRTYTVCGTPEYLAPEIILRKGYGHSVDWWTLGVLIFEMAAGYPPFTAKDTMKLYEKIIACKYAFPSNFTSDVKDIIRNILQVDTSKRFGNLKGGADDIKHHKFFKSIQWLPLANKKLVSPFIPHVSGPSDVSNFQRCSEEPLAEIDPVLVSSTVVVAFPTPTLPVVLLLQPLRKRFVFHFSGKSRTNRIDKPEWYFTQVLTWIKDHENFLLNWVQPVYDDMDIGKSALAEFMGGLVELSLVKLQADIEQAQYDDVTYSHIVDEALAYERELRQTYFYPQALPGPVQILSQAQLFVKWLSMEKKFAREKMDAMMKSETAWTSLAGDADEDLVTEVAHSFLALLSTMSDRYSLLPQPGHRLQFVELVLEIIDDLRISLLQVLNTEQSDPLNSKHPQILNTVFHVKNAIEQYDSSPAMLLLSHYRSQLHVSPLTESDEGRKVSPKNEPTGGIFQNALDLLERLQNQLLNELCDNLMMEVKAKSRPYRKDKWHGMTEEDVDTSVVTLSGCTMYQALADQLHIVHRKINKRLFSSFWKMVANSICMFFLEEIVLDNYFNPYGGQVLAKDVNRFLIPLFQHYSEVPSTYFAKLQEACKVLALPSLPTAVKHAAIAGTSQELMAALDLPLTYVTGERLCTVISRRVDVIPSIM